MNCGRRDEMEWRDEKALTRTLAVTALVFGSGLAACERTNAPTPNAGESSVGASKAVASAKSALGGKPGEELVKLLPVRADFPGGLDLNPMSPVEFKMYATDDKVATQPAQCVAVFHPGFSHDAIIGGESVVGSQGSAGLVAFDALLARAEAGVDPVDTLKSTLSGCAEFSVSYTGQPNSKPGKAQLGSVAALEHAKTLEFTLTIDGPVTILVGSSRSLVFAVLSTGDDASSARDAFAKIAENIDSASA